MTFLVAVFGDAEGAGELPRVHRRGADIAGLARLDDVVQSFERFFDLGVVVQAMGSAAKRIAVRRMFEEVDAEIQGRV